jgi:ubiquinone/menaquinone biosynthesis C-methylase UbiE
LSCFDDLAEKWDADPAKRERALAWAREIRKQVPLTRNMTAMEYGCGTGLLSLHLHADLGHIIAADRSQGMLDVLDARIRTHGIPNMETQRLDLTEDPLPMMKLDLIYTAMTLHHIADIDRILEAFSSLLKEGGWLGIIDLDTEDGSFHGFSFDGHRGFDRKILAGRLRQAELLDIRSCTVCTITKVVGGGREQRFPLFFMRGRKAETGLPENRGI